MPEPQTLRVVVASPGDVQAERGVMPHVVEDLNDGIAQEYGVRLELAMWETDAYPGFHLDGPQGLIDPILRVEDCDILIGIFWKHFGTPTQAAESGTEHEFRTAYAAWQQHGRPQIMAYFNQKTGVPKTSTEAEQLGRVLAFQEHFPKEGLWWPYKGKTQFERLVHRHLTKVLREMRQSRDATTGQERKSDAPEPAPIAAGVPSVDAEEALSRYRQVLVNNSRNMSLRGLDVGASDPTGQQQRLDLAQVYVDLLTTSQVEAKRKGRRQRSHDILRDEQETEPLSALKAVVTHRRVVLLGDPGSGKSTFVTYLGLCLAAHGLDLQEDWAQRLPDWDWEQEDTLVPVVCILRDFARWLPEDVSGAKPKHLWDFVTDRLGAQNLSFVVQPLHECLEKGQAMLLLDGLDEVPTQQQRTLIRDAVAVFAKRYPQCRYIVTCRTLSYQSPDWQLADFESFTLAPFHTEQINRFIGAWYNELARLGTIKPGAVGATTQHLQAAVQRPDLQRLASNPLLLTAMALVHTHKGRLPDARALLYEETVDILLWRWEQLKSEGEQTRSELRSLLSQAERTDVDLKRALWGLAFAAHQQGGTPDTETVADIGELQLYKTLMELHPNKSRDWAAQVIEVIKLRAGLLLERESEVYTFPHRTFQEYLAGAYLSSEPDFARQAALLAAEGALWREVILLAVGRLVYLSGDTAKPLSLVAELCPAQFEATDMAWRQAWLAGDVLLEMGRNRVADSSLGRELAERVGQRLVDLLRKERLSPVERAAAGDVLGRLGDPRFRTDAWSLPNEDMLGFAKIPAGPFLMGSKNSDQDAEDDEKPPHKLKLPTYYIGRYPVTVGQFAAFVEASGYEPQDEDYRQQGPLNRPVVNVTWYDALAYCEWLTEILREWEGTPEPLATLLRDKDWQVTLSSEAEWEKAARGAEGSVYPWGDKFDAAKANVAETGINRTSAVGSFPSDASPYEVLDMSGNVWEWTRSLWEREDDKEKYTYPYQPKDGREDLNASEDTRRVLRGGGFFDLRGLARCACRDGLTPVGGHFDGGFRVVVLPPSEL